ncbi:cell division protein FtsI/penicillin-binding protein 2 [Clostridium aceticum]|uniref:Cell division protein FtsI/penicillin-binding protein 2 n=1 Tax=Clostridium aceticum TaxID=84022 RepID=A0A0D8I6V0_9CLOT|nr:penicillin-binding transpeptidase domain-containing protein [Clostridium aceticum]AKL93720.1 cell division protein FtsI/penicillin-binding protein 2 [Clostridium aceticum]KJF25767.1 peptidoglycan glycosyltransferase [Clostridium aceticum]
MLENNKRIVHLIIITSFLFLSIIGYLTYFQIFRAADVIDNPYNKRQWAREDNTLRGIIYDRRGVALAQTEIVNERPVRRYPFDQLYSHIIGYSYRQYGRSGIEAFYNQQLMALTNDSPVTRIREQLAGEMVKGNNLLLTIDHEVQKTAERLLRGKTGSAVVIDPTTGEILAMVSKPDFNPNTLVDDWGNLVNDEGSPLLNRSTGGLYPPGSTYKTVITAAILENPHILDEHYDCTGSITIDGYTLSDYGNTAHGRLDLTESLVVSCNTNFARMAVDLGEARITEIARRFFMEKSIPSDIPIRQSRFPYEGGIPTTDLAAVGIGQGKLLVTPLHMALIAGTFANNGVMMEPYIIEEIQSAEGRTVERKNPHRHEIVSHEIAAQVRDMMIAAVARGTGRRAAISGTTVGGKTGTAENATGRSHAWFIGFATRGERQVAVAVILESSGETGGTAAAPLAREMMQEALRRSD